MIDIKARLLSLESDFNNKYTSLADIYETLKSTNINLTYSEISEYLLSELDDLNPRGQIHFIDDDSIEEWVYAYGVPSFKRKNNQAIKFHDHINLFFDFIDLVDKNKINEISGFKYNFDIWGISWVKASDIFIERRKIEIALNCEIKTINKVKEPIQNIKATITKDNTKLLQQLAAKDEEILRLKEEIESLKQQTVEQEKDNDFTPCYLNKFTSIDPLAIAIQVRNSEWKDYDPEIDFKRSAAQIKNTIKKKYKDLGVSDTLAEMIEKIACPIDRTRNK